MCSEQVRTDILTDTRRDISEGYPHLHGERLVPGVRVPELSLIPRPARVQSPYTIPTTITTAASATTTTTTVGGGGGGGVKGGGGTGCAEEEGVLCACGGAEHSLPLEARDEPRQGLIGGAPVSEGAGGALAECGNAAVRCDGDGEVGPGGDGAAERERGAAPGAQDEAAREGAAAAAGGGCGGGRARASSGVGSGAGAGVGAARGAAGGEPRALCEGPIEGFFDVDGHAGRLRSNTGGGRTESNKSGAKLPNQVTRKSAPGYRKRVLAPAALLPRQAGTRTSAAKHRKCCCK